MVTLGRFEILAPLGAGGMGTVYRARDPKLHREVALKVLRGADRLEAGATVDLGPGSQQPDDEGPHTEVISQRISSGLVGDTALLDEARAMARLTHPNVVSVYDIGSDGDRLFIAMELVEGRNVREWLRSEPPRAAILDVFRQAATGLSAAHAHGIVHRDLKPENILVGDDGITRVADFGLAMLTAAPRASRPLAGGTAGYMAPELRGVATTATTATTASDVYAFCVSLRQALGAGESDWKDLPKSLREALQRGVDASPAARPSAGELVDLLAPRRPRTVPVVAAIIAAGAASFAIVASRGAGGPSCDTWPELDATLDDAGTARIAAAIAGQTTTLAAETAPRVADNLQRSGRRLRARWSQACRNQDDKALACVDEQLLAFGAVVRFLERSGATADPTRMVELSQLSDRELCRQQGPGGGASTTDGRAARSELERLVVEVDGGTRKWSDSIGELEGLLARVEAFGDDGLTADVLYELGRGQEAVDKFELAEKSFRRVTKLAEAKDDRRFAYATIRLARLVGLRKHAARAAESILAFAEPVIAASKNDYSLAGFYYQTQAELNYTQFRFEAELVALEKEAAVLELAVEPRLRLRRRRALARVAEIWSDFDSAAKQRSALVEEQREIFGPSHPRVSGALLDLARGQSLAGAHHDAYVNAMAAASIDQQNGRDAAALAAEQAAAHALGESDPRAAIARLKPYLGKEGLSSRAKRSLALQLAQLCLRAGDLKRAAVLLDDADALSLSLPRGVSTSLVSRIDLAERRGDLDAALEYARAHLEERQREHPDVPYLHMGALATIGRVHLARGEAEKARELLEQAVDSCKDVGIRWLECARVRLSLGRAQNELGRADEAAKTFARTEGMFEAGTYFGDIRRFEVARSKVLRGDQEALEDARRAVASLAKSAPYARHDWRFARDWLEKRSTTSRVVDRKKRRHRSTVRR